MPKKVYYKKCQCSTNLQPVFSGATWELDLRSRPIFGLTIESVKDLWLEVYHNTPKIYTNHQ